MGKRTVRFIPGGKREAKFYAKFSLWKSELTKSAKGFALKVW